VDSVKVSTRYGFRPNALQIRPKLDLDSAESVAIDARVQ
jgi:hypothetical protein